MAASPERRAPIRLDRDKNLEAKSHHGVVVPSGIGRQAKESYLTRLESLLDENGKDWFVSWVDSGDARCELASWITGRKTPYVDPRRAETALRQRRDGLACIGLVGELLLAAAEMANGQKVNFTHRGADLVIGRLQREVKTINLKLTSKRTQPQLVVSRAQYMNPDLTSFQVYVQAEHPQLGVRQLWADVPADVMRKHIEQRHRGQLEQGGRVVVKFDTSDASPFFQYFHANFASLVEALEAFSRNRV